MDSQTWTTCPPCQVSLKTRAWTGISVAAHSGKVRTRRRAQLDRPCPHVFIQFALQSQRFLLRLAHLLLPKSSQPKPISDRLTKDGYRIDTCWQCKRRICRVPTKHNDRVHEIDWRGYAADRHCCDGPDGTLDSLDRADSFSSQWAVVAICRQIRFSPKKRS